MTLFSAPEIKVGLMVLLVSGLIATMSLRVSQNPSYLGNSKEAFFYLEDASGLVKRSNVKTAGIDVGIIKDIKLENGMARVELVLMGDTPLTKSARIEIRPNGILGDKHVEIISGDPRDPPLRNGEQILVVDDRASVDRLIGEVSKITKSLTAVAENIKSATEGDTDKPLGRIINNIERLTADVAKLSGDNRERIDEIIENVHNVTGTLDQLINDDGPDGFKVAWKDALHSLKRIEKSLKNVEEITDKVNRGEGTIGRLVNDESTVEELNTAINGVNNFLDSANKLQTAIDFNSAAFSSGSYRTAIGLQIQPGLDRYYELGVVFDQKGVKETQTTTTTVNGAPQTVTKEEKRYEDKYKFNALFAKNFYNFTVKGGLIESSGGAGLEYSMFRKKLRISLEAFDFTDLHLRSYAKLDVYNGIYLTAGGDDLVDKKNSSGFIGAGIFLTNDDLKLFVSRMPF